MPVAGADQRQPAPLRHGAPQPLAGERAAQIGGERRALADGVDTGLLARMGDHRRHVAGGEDPRIAGRTQGFVDRDEAVRSVSGSPVSASQGAAPASVTHSASSKSTRLPSAQISDAGRDPDDLAAGQHGDPALGEDPLEEPADAPVVRRQQRVPGDQGNLDRTAAQPGEPILRRERQLDAAGAAADHREAQPRHLAGAGEQRLPARRETGDRLDRDRVLGRAGDIVGPRRRADVDRQQVVADRRMGAAQDKALGPVEADRLVADQPRAGKPREPAEIDVALLERVMPGDIARQHARIGRLDVAG